MPIPDYQSLLLPLLMIARDGKEHALDEAIEDLARQFKLGGEDRKELLPSGRQAKFDNRVGWARTYLKKAGLLETTGRGRFRITQLGLGVLEESPSKIDVKFLERFPTFVEFRKISRGGGGQDSGNGETDEEKLEAIYQNLRRALALELLDHVKKSSPNFFEKLVVDLLVKMGYGGSRKDAGEAVGQSGDGGIDGIIKEDKLGLDAVYVQAKRWEGTVGEPIVRNFAGSLDGRKARKGVLITTSRFSPEAERFAERIEKRIVLLDGERLTQLMIDHGIGVAELANYPVKKVDLDYFGAED